MSNLSAERHRVLHSWCVQTDWDTPTIAGDVRGGRGLFAVLDRLIAGSGWS